MCTCPSGKNHAHTTCCHTACRSCRYQPWSQLSEGKSNCQSFENCQSLPCLTRWAACTARPRGSILTTSSGMHPSPPSPLRYGCRSQCLLCKTKDSSCRCPQGSSRRRTSKFRLLLRQPSLGQPPPFERALPTKPHPLRPHLTRAAPSSAAAALPEALLQCLHRIQPLPLFWHRRLLGTLKQLFGMCNKPRAEKPAATYLGEVTY
mmetsp:Transcript_62982/g.111868  ORF Transcript_62982/g.111868 Transcript_62982/m.111868 type:complete len:205 (-) Transcript_62982:51-665(-)